MSTMCLSSMPCRNTRREMIQSPGCSAHPGWSHEVEVTIFLTLTCTNHCISKGCIPLKSDSGTPCGGKKQDAFYQGWNWSHAVSRSREWQEQNPLELMGCSQEQNSSSAGDTKGKMSQIHNWHRPKFQGSHSTLQQLKWLIMWEIVHRLKFFMVSCQPWAMAYSEILLFKQPFSTLPRLSIKVSGSIFKHPA